MNDQAEKRKTFFVTKYWQTRGLLTLSGRIYPPEDPPLPGSRYLTDVIGGCYFLKIGRDCFPTEDEALAAVRASAQRKAKALRKQLAEMVAVSEGGPVKRGQ